MKNKLFRVFLGLFTAIALISTAKASGEIAISKNQKSISCKPADIVLLNGYIYTGVKNNVVQSLAIRNEKILCTGSTKSIERYIGKRTQVIDLQGRMVLPGFVASHMHPSLVAGILSNGVDVSVNEDGSTATTGAEYLENIKRYADANPNLAYINGFNYNRALFISESGDALSPTALDLDTAVPDRPAAIFELNGHSIWCNSKWLGPDFLDLDTRYPSPDQPINGVIERYPSGPMQDLATGQLNENALTLIINATPPAEKALFQEVYLSLIEYFNSAGITSVFDAMNCIYGNIELQKTYNDYINELAEANLLTCQVRGAWYINPADLSQDPKNPSEQISLVSEIANGYTTDLFKTKCVKFFADGILEGGTEGTALLLKPYCSVAQESQCGCGASNYYGLDFWGNSGNSLIDAMKKANNNKLQIHVHCIGDGAVKKVVDSFEVAGICKKYAPSIAHVQLCDAKTRSKMAKLGVTVSITPTWTQLDVLQSVFYNPRLGFERAYNKTYEFQSLYNKKINVSVGSDFPVASPDYNVATYTGMTRLLPPSLYEVFYGDTAKYPYTTDLNNRYLCTDFPNDLETDPIPIGPQRPNLGDPNDQRIYPLDRLINSYSLAGAKQLLLEKKVGTIEKGKFANLVVWDTNWFQYAPIYRASNNVDDLEPVANSQVDITFFKGKVVYSRLPMLSPALLFKPAKKNSLLQPGFDVKKVRFHAC